MNRLLFTNRVLIAAALLFIHMITVGDIFNAHGGWAATAAFILIGCSEFFWLIRCALVQALINPYDVFMVVMLLAVIGLFKLDDMIEDRMATSSSRP